MQPDSNSNQLRLTPTFISATELQRRCQDGDFYVSDQNANEDIASAVRQKAIYSLQELLEGNDFVFVSNYLNPHRLIFVDIEIEGLCPAVVNMLYDWATLDQHSHAIRCTLYDGKTTNGCFLVLKGHLLFEDLFRKIKWLHHEYEKVPDETFASDNRRSAPRQPPEGPPPAKPGSAPK